MSLAAGPEVEQAGHDRVIAGHLAADPQALFAGEGQQLYDDLEAFGGYPSGQVAARVGQVVDSTDADAHLEAVPVQDLPSGPSNATRSVWTVRWPKVSVTGQPCRGAGPVSRQLVFFRLVFGGLVGRLAVRRILVRRPGVAHLLTVWPLIGRRGELEGTDLFEVDPGACAVRRAGGLSHPGGSARAE